MADRYYTIVTDSGIQKMFEAVNGGKKVIITEFAVGDGGGSSCTPTTGQTGLKNEVWRGQVIDCYVSDESENQLIAESIIPSDAGGFTIREMGLFDDSGTLIAVCNTPDTQKVRVSDGVVHELNLLMEVALSNTESIELVVDPNIVTATKKDVENLRLEVKTEAASMAKEIENLKTDVGKKVNKVPGMGLSSNDYTTEEKTKLKGIASGAEVNVKADWNVTDSTSDAFIKNKPTSLKNPNLLTFTGGATESYDGSLPKSVEIPYKVSQLDNDKGYLNNTQVEALVADGIVDKVDKIPGKGLSAHDFTDEYMSYVDSLPETMSTVAGQITNLTQSISGVGKQAGQAYGLATDALAATGELENTKLDKIKNITDWNEARKTGFYVGADNVLNSPAPLKFLAIVISLDDTRTIQILYNYMDVSVPSGIQVVFTRLGKKVDNDTFVWLPYIDQTKKHNSKDDDGIVIKGSGHANQVWKTDASGNPAWRDDANTTYNVVSKTANGLVPKLPNESIMTKYLRQDGTWSVPPVLANETGVWTPSVSYNSGGSLASLTVTNRKGYYVKLGRLVYVKGFVVLHSMFNSEYFYIGDLPFAKNNESGNFDMEIGNAYFLSTDTTIPDKLASNEVDRISFFGQNGLRLYKNTTAATKTLYFTIIYAS